MFPQTGNDPNTNRFFAVRCPERCIGNGWVAVPQAIILGLTSRIDLGSSSLRCPILSPLNPLPPRSLNNPTKPRSFWGMAGAVNRRHLNDCVYYWFSCIVYNQWFHPGLCFSPRFSNCVTISKCFSYFPFIFMISICLYIFNLHVIHIISKQYLDYTYKCYLLALSRFILSTLATSHIFTDISTILCHPSLNL